MANAIENLDITEAEERAGLKRVYDLVDELPIPPDKTRQLAGYIARLERQLAESQWREITPENLPKVGTEVLAGFQGQFRWVSFVAEVTKDGIRAPGYAEPTHWYPLPCAPARADEASK